MRRPRTAFTSASAGAIVGAVLSLTASVATAQQLFQAPPAPRPQPSASAEAPSPSFDPMATARNARTSLRNGIDFIKYKDYTRALRFLREAESRQAELDPAERKALAMSLAHAQKMIQDGSVKAGPSPATLANNARRDNPALSGAMALAELPKGDAVQLTSATQVPLDGPKLELDNVKAAAGEVELPAPRQSEPSAKELLPPDAQAAPAPSLPAPAAVELPPLTSTNDAAGPAARPEPLTESARPVARVAPSQDDLKPPAPLSLEPLPEPTPPPAQAKPPAATQMPAPAPATAAEPETTRVLSLEPLPEPAQAPAKPVELPAQAKPLDMPEPTKPAELPALPEPTPAPAQSPAPAPAPAPEMPQLPAPAASPLPLPTEAPTPIEPANPTPAPAPVAAPAPAPAEEVPVAVAPLGSPAPVPASDLPALPAGEPTPPVAPAVEPPPAPEAEAVRPTPAPSPVAAPASSSPPTIPVEESTEEDVAQIAHRHLQEARAPQQPVTPEPQPADVTGGGMGLDSPTRFELIRPPSSTEARPLRRIPVPDEFVSATKREWTPVKKFWAAPATCHMPLYFQDATLERYGRSAETFLGTKGRFFTYPLDNKTQSNQRNQILQPFFSAGLFAFQIAALPYNMVVDPPWEAEYDLGYYRPGDRMPPDTFYLPLHGIGPPLHGSNY